MTEIGDLFETFVSMTVHAIRRQCPFVKILVAAKAIRLQPHVGAFHLPYLGVADMIILVALRTCYFFMGAFQHITGQPVVETQGIEPDHIEFPAMVVTVAGDAFLAGDDLRGVIPFSAGDPGIQHCVTLQAFLIGDLLVQHVAFGTVGEPFQVGMDFR